MLAWLLVFLLLAGVATLVGVACDRLDRYMDRDHTRRDSDAY